VSNAIKPLYLNKKRKYLWFIIVYAVIFFIAKCDTISDKWQNSTYDLNVPGVSFSVGRKATAAAVAPAPMIPGKDAEIVNKDVSTSTAGMSDSTIHAPDANNQSRPEPEHKSPQYKSGVTKLTTDVVGFDPLSTSSPKEVELLMKLSARRHDIEKREAHLKIRESTVMVAEKQQQNKAEELTKLKESIELLLKKTDKTAEGQFVNLVKIYEGMKPKSAAQVFEKLDIAVLKNIIPLMAQRKVSSILEQMNVIKAKELSLVLIGDKNPFATPTKK